MPIRCTLDALTALPASPCPRLDWEERLAEALTPQSPIFVNVGANKGYNAASFLALHSDRRVSARAWHRHVRGAGVADPVACGMCKPCLMGPPKRHSRRGGTAHLLELTGNNRRLLRDVLNASGLAERATVHDAGASNASAEVTIKARAAGVEDGAVAFGAEISAHRATEVVRLTTLDAFLSATFGDTREIYHVSIDTEGHDALVLEGARRALRAKRVTLLEFEYSGRGYWAAGADGRTLGATLGWLAEDGYACWWQTRHDLVAASPPCWTPAMESRKWSNLVCTHKADAIAVLDGIAQEGEARRRRECTRSGASFANGKRMTRSDAKAWCGPRWKPAVASA